MITTVLSETRTHRRVLTHYAPDEECRAHRHSEAQISLLLAGSYVEDGTNGLHAVAGSSLSCKPGGFEHQNRFGDHGALILSVHDKTRMAAIAGYSVSALETRLAGMRLLDRAVAGEPLGVVGTSRQGGAREAEPTQPALRDARRRLLGEPDLSVAHLARSVGVHPVHLARLFRNAFGQPPARIRREVRAARVIDRIVRSKASLAEIAFAEGFSDQAHMTRAVGQVSGWSPGGLRWLLAT
ncbi:helix-turn-helix transcriptional regulator [Brevundimonas sp. GCM10030266]|uniref:helix-turn-helix transcriptional regulator n=1 Tax=Brevundimonas sp. GCM10030266 TaxID=3273386 RepID=UPI003606B63B